MLLAIGTSSIPALAWSTAQNDNRAIGTLIIQKNKGTKTHSQTLTHNEETRTSLVEGNPNGILESESQERMSTFTTLRLTDGIGVNINYHSPQ